VQAASPLAAGLLAIALAATCGPDAPAPQDGRGVTPSRPRNEVAAQCDREQSAALFVGVRKFQHERTIDVPFAADDAVDLAYMFAIERRVSLVRRDRVVLALSGKPVKEESQRRLEELRKAGAQIVEAKTQSDILVQLRRQADRAGAGGILIVSLATHGFVSDGVPYVLSASSLIHDRETSLSPRRSSTSPARRRHSAR
jgi:hypothetical protein